MSTLTIPLAALVSVFAVITVTPDPIAIHLGPISVFWYGICYAAGIAATYVVVTREARRRGLNARLVDNGIIIVAVAALIGGRLYHVIDQWQLYKDDLTRIVLPPYTGLGVYGGIFTGVLAAWFITRRWHQSFWRWADVVAPGLFVMQAIGRWGNFFNQELYGPPTNLPWGITIDCAHRVADFPCDTYPAATTAFHPLFLYESVSGVLGAIALLWIARRYGRHMRPGDLLLIFFIWYAAVRLVLETLRTGNWTFFGVPTAIVISAIAIVGSLLVLAIRHRPGAAEGDRWGDPPEPEDDDDWLDDETAEDAASDAIDDDAIDDWDEDDDESDDGDEPESDAGIEPARGDGDEPESEAGPAADDRPATGG
jgi:phosphatidylglycerol:prolipoprotein diacylglycerol transferase